MTRELADGLRERVKDALHQFPFFPELGKLHRGKVRDNYTRDGRMISIATDRVSAFDVVFDEPIPLKGELLTSIARFWFERTKDIALNHVVESPDPNVLVVRQCKPFDVEFIIRGYITGSAWKDYDVFGRGVRGPCYKSGVRLPDGMRKNQKFERPIITNTTKAKTGHDVDITRDQILEQKLLTAEQLDLIEQKMRALYERGVEVAAERGLILVDTKYEFGMDEQGNILLIDEVHTPDSSRYWHSDTYQERFGRGEEQRELSKEFLRSWLKQQGFEGKEGQRKPNLPVEVIAETAARYAELYETVTRHTVKLDEPRPVKDRITANLRKARLLKGQFVQIIAGSEADKEHYGAIEKHLKALGVPCGVEVLSAHKQTRELLAFLEQISTSAEPVVYITVAGRSNALGGVVASQANNPKGFPVINCPPIKDTATLAVDIYSSLRMPSKIPALTVLEPENAAIAARDILKLTEYAVH